MTEKRTAQLPDGKGFIEYRLPNALEQLRFYTKTKWYDLKVMQDGCQRLLNAIDGAREYIISVGGSYSSLDDVLSDRNNLGVVMDVVYDIAGKEANEMEKKHFASLLSTSRVDSKPSQE